MNDDDIEERFSGLGAVTIRRMFGGKGVYRNGLIIAVDLGGGMLLKADATTAPDFRTAGATQWVYEGRKGRSVHMPYWSIPEDALDDPDLMTKWARLAYEAAIRSTSK